MIVLPSDIIHGKFQPPTLIRYRDNALSASSKGHVTGVRPLATVDILNDSPSIGHYPWQILTANSYSLPRYALSARSKGHVTYKPLYLVKGSFSDHVCNVNLNQR